MNASDSIEDKDAQWTLIKVAWAFSYTWYSEMQREVALAAATINEHQILLFGRAVGIKEVEVFEFNT